MGSVSAVSRYKSGRFKSSRYMGRRARIGGIALGGPHDGWHREPDSERSRGS